MHAFGGLLLVIFASLCFQLAAPTEAWARLVTIVLQGGVLVLALRVSRTRTLLSWWTAAAVAIAVAVAIAAILVVDRDAEAPAHAVGLAIVLLAVVAIALGVAVEARENGVNLRTVAGALSVYLLLGITYSTGYQLSDDLSASQFFAQAGSPATADFLYYSYVTLTTTGFGDLTVATNVGRSITISEALIGQIYLVTVVAVIVANLAPRSRRSTS